MPDTSHNSSSPAKLLGYLTIAVSGAVLVGWCFNIPALKSILPGFVTMKANTAIGFILAGVALALLAGVSPSPSAPARWLARACAAIVALLGLLPLLGYLYGASGLIGIGRYTQMAVHTSLLFLVLSAGVLLLPAAHNLTSLISSDTRGGWLLRRLGPFIIGLPMLLGWLRIMGERSDYFESALGTALMMLLLITLFATLVWWTAQILTRDDVAAKHDAAVIVEREALYHSLFTHMLNGYAYCRMVFDEGQPRDFIYLATNDAFSQLTGLRDVLGKNIREVIPGHIEADPELFALYSRVATTGQPEQREIFVASLQMWLMLSVYCPAPEHFVAVFDVITDRKRADAQIAASELRYRRLFEAAHDGILILDAETGMVVDVNPYLIELLGVTREVFLGKKVWELGFFTDLVGNEANFVELQAKQYIRYEDMALEGYDGKRHEVEFVSNVYLVDGQQVIQCNIRDITERKRMEELMQRQVEDLHARNVELERLNRLSAGRELRMIALKQQANDMAAQLGQPPPYALAFMDATAIEVMRTMATSGESEAEVDPLPVPGELAKGTP